MTTASHQLIKRAFERKKRDFPGFSLRWMSSQLSISHSYLSQVLSGKRAIPIKLVEPLCQILDLDLESRTKIFQQAFKSKGYFPDASKKSAPKTAAYDWTLVPLKDFDVMSRWESLAILQTTLLHGYDGTADFVAKRLGLSPEPVEASMLFLQSRGFLTMQNGKLRISQSLLEFQSKAKKDHIRNYHKSVLQRARDVLDSRVSEEDLEQRLITSAVFTCSQQSIGRLKEKISEFLKEMVEESSEQKPEQVYQLAVQFFPVTQPASAAHSGQESTDLH